MAESYAPHSCPADSTSVFSTACRSKVERLRTLSMSAVAVWCSSATESSAVRSPTTFSSCWAACSRSANNRSSAIALSRNTSTAWPISVIFVMAANRNCDVATSTYYGAHSSRKRGESRNNIPPDIEPDNKDRAGEAEHDNRQQCDAAELLDGLRLICGRRDTAFRSGD